MLSFFAGQFLLEEARLIEAAEMAKKAAELDSTEFDVVFNAAHMLRLVVVEVVDLMYPKRQGPGFMKAINFTDYPVLPTHSTCFL